MLWPPIAKCGIVTTTNNVLVLCHQTLTLHHALPDYLPCHSDGLANCGWLSLENQSFQSRYAQKLHKFNLQIDRSTNKSMLDFLVYFE